MFRHLLCAAAVVVLASTAGCASADPSDDERTATVAQPVLLADFFSQVALAQDGSRASKATGAIEVPFLDASTHVQRKVGSFDLRGTCGVTFISPHYAITAAHCLTDENAWAPASQIFTVRTFDITTMSSTSLFFDSNLSGTWPNFTGKRMDLEPGYNSTPLACTITARCGFSEGGKTATDYNCGMHADVAMLRCRTRSATEPYVNVASSDPGTGEVESYWFHEIVNAPWTGTPTDPTTLSLQQHYTNLGEPQSNWHYVAAPTNVLIPVKSANARKRLGPDSTDARWTDLFGCHGTSGAGVLQRASNGSLELLGPVHHGNFRGLCNSPTAQTGIPSISYENNDLVRQLTGKFSRALWIDRLTDFDTVPIATQSASFQ